MLAVTPRFVLLVLSIATLLVSTSAQSPTGTDCTTVGCSHGGTCDVLLKKCLCAAGFTGPFCTTSLCSAGCVHGDCVLSGGSYQCVCQSGWKATDCSANIDDCGSSPCEHGGTCIDGINAYTCTCDFGWNGTRCSVGYTANTEVALVYANKQYDPRNDLRLLLPNLVPPLSSDQIRTISYTLAQIFSSSAYSEDIETKANVAEAFALLSDPVFAANMSISEQTPFHSASSSFMRCWEESIVYMIFDPPNGSPCGTTRSGSSSRMSYFTQAVELTGNITTQQRSLQLGNAEFTFPVHLAELLSLQRAVCPRTMIMEISVNTSVFATAINSPYIEIVTSIVAGAVESITTLVDGDFAYWKLPMKRNLTSELAAGIVQCVAYGVRSGIWETEGCSLDSVDFAGNTLTCKCSHLSTVTALIMLSPYHAQNVYHVDYWIYTGCIFLIVCVLFVMIIYCRISALRKADSTFFFWICVQLILFEVFFIANTATAGPQITRSLCFGLGLMLLWSGLSVLSGIFCQWAYLFMQTVQKKTKEVIRYRELIFHAVFWPIFVVAVYVGVKSAVNEWDTLIGFSLIGNDIICLVPDTDAQVVLILVPVAITFLFGIVCSILSYKSLRAAQTNFSQKTKNNETFELEVQVTVRETHESKVRSWTIFTVFATLAALFVLLIILVFTVATEVLFVITHIFLGMAFVLSFIFFNDDVRRIFRRDARRTAVINHSSARRISFVAMYDTSPDKTNNAFPDEMEVVSNPLSDRSMRLEYSFEDSPALAAADPPRTGSLMVAPVENMGLSPGTRRGHRIGQAATTPSGSNSQMSAVRSNVLPWLHQREDSSDSSLAGFNEVLSEQQDALAISQSQRSLGTRENSTSTLQTTDLMPMRSSESLKLKTPRSMQEQMIARSLSSKRKARGSIKRNPVRAPSPLSRSHSRLDSAADDNGPELPVLEDEPQSPEQLARSTSSRRSGFGSPTKFVPSPPSQSYFNAHRSNLSIDKDMYLDSNV